jgi:hypothetical protein
METEPDNDNEDPKEVLEQSLCLYLDERVELAREIEHLRKLLGLPDIIEEEDWEALHGRDHEGDIRYRLIEHHFCHDETDYEMMFDVLRREEGEAMQEIARLRKLLGPRPV